MIVCVTANPCLDKTLEVPAWRPGDNVRGTGLRETAGGKGNNVARALQRLGQTASPALFLGGIAGERCRDLLRHEDGLDPLVVPSAAPTRVILTARAPGDAATAFFDPDPAISPGEAAQLAALVADALGRGDVAALTLSGSSPSPATHRLYAGLVAEARRHGVPVFVDTYGPALAALVEAGAWPDALQLNRREAGIHLGTAEPSDAALEGLLDAWAGAGIPVVVLSDGPGPVRARVDGRAWVAHPPEIEPVNPIGSGDCLLAGLVDGRLRRLPPADLLRHAVACAVANALVWDAGDLRREHLDAVAPRVRVAPA